ncbi:MerR family transcriptional regulator [Amycolatopsis sp. NPDC051758]|uniref:MerR family transcriptional regulator n=1 Tax=Amycolatopsis sp. NPDC051758 TaxID=3363935 RepID=UPI0037B68B4B
MQIGEVAERTGLSLRTIRYYEEVGLVVPSARSQGGFRLYRQREIDRLRLIMRMKPLGFQLEEMRDLLAIVDPGPGDPEVADPRARLAGFVEAAERSRDELRAKLHTADEFAAVLRARLADFSGESAGTAS